MMIVTGAEREFGRAGWGPGVLDAERRGVGLKMQPRAVVVLGLARKLRFGVNIVLVEGRDFQQMRLTQWLAKFEIGSSGVVVVLGKKGVRPERRAVGGRVKRVELVDELVKIQSRLDISRTDCGIADEIVTFLVPLRPIVMSLASLGDLPRSI
jgi:hypothetical protein